MMDPKLKGTKTEANLWTAVAGESQARNKYSYFGITLGRSIHPTKR